MIPPDVTLTTSSASTRTTTGSAGGGSTITSAPGLAGAAGGQAAGAGSATPPNTAPAGPRPPASAGGTYLNAHPNANPANTTPSSIPAHGAGIFRGSGVKPDPAKPDPIATLETSKGVIKIMLFRKLAPITVENFIDLCSKGFYNGKTFHRVEPGFVIQGGDPMGNGQGDYIDPSTHQIRYLPLETSPSLKHNAPGVVAMARKGQSLDSASCQFYITLAACPQLDGKYAVFGGVVSGLDVVQKIAIGDKILTATVEEQQ